MNDSTLRVYDSILGLLPGEENPTPLVRLHRVAPLRHAVVYAKLEWYNPFGAVKDRIAANMVRDAERRGALGAGNKLVEPTSGNTGLGLAMIANAKGYALQTPLSMAIPLEKRTILRFFGSTVVELDDTLCPAPGAPEGAIAEATATARNHPEFVMLNQYENEANAEAHALTTGPEIWKQTGGKVTHFIAGMGTCGTITGAGGFLKAKNPDIRVTGVHPEDGHDIPGVRSLQQLKQTKLYRPDQYDGMEEVANRDAYDMCLRLNREESVIAGPSSGMALVGALRAVPDTPGTVAVVIFPDNVFKYASSMQRHFPKLCPAPAAGGEDPFLRTLLETARNSHNTISADDLSRALNHAPRPTLIDVRIPEHFHPGHLPGSLNIPLDDLPGRAAELPSDRTAPIVTICSVGKISLNAMLLLKAMGYPGTRNLAGGATAWMERGYGLAEGR